MNATAVPNPARPFAALRVGVTGKRTLTSEQSTSLTDQLRYVLGLVRDQVASLASDPAAQSVYAPAPTADGKPLLRLLSPLAEGADRLAARVAPDCGYTLHVPLPFKQGEYEQDFLADPQRGKPDTTGEFTALLPTAANARLTLDGGRDHAGDGSYDEARSYEAAGRTVVRNADLMIALWDGAPPKGWGGTAEIIRFALESGTPVCWIDTGDATVKFLESPHQMQPAATTQPFEAALRIWLTRLIVPPQLERPANNRLLLERLVDFLRWFCRRPRKEPLDVYLNEPEPPPGPRPWFWRAHTWLIETAARHKVPNPGPQEDPPDPIPRAWFHHFMAADARANEHAARYRSVYVWAFAFAALSLICAATSLAFQQNALVEWAALAIEVGSLLAVLLLIVANIWQDWHQRWIDYRLLTELCRKQQALAPLGWSLPGRAIDTLADRVASPSTISTPSDPDRTAWVAWFFAALRRAADLPSGQFDAALIGRCRKMVREDLIEAQIAYHEGRAQQYDRAGHFFELLGEALFLLILFLVGAKLWLLMTHPDHHLLLAALGLATSVAPTIAAASIGIRAYAELQVLARQSHHMRNTLQRAVARVQELEPTDDNRTLASQDFGAVTLEVATMMLQDIDGWARLFRVKVVEA
jgi:hypothetical protein